MTSTPVARVRRLSKSYDSPTGRTVVLDGLDLTIAEGEKVGLVGPSGSGKSTLLGLLAGLLTPDAGMVEIDGQPLAGLDDRARAQLRAGRVGVALQSDNLIPFLTAGENVELALGFGGHRRGRHRRAAELLEATGCGGRSRHLPRQLSGGEAQRVALAVALANRPALLLADEMVSQLDPHTAAQVVETVFSSELAVLFATHDLALADRADRRLRLCAHSLVAA